MQILNGVGESEPGSESRSHFRLYEGGSGSIVRLCKLKSLLPFRKSYSRSESQRDKENTYMLDRRNIHHLTFKISLSFKMT